MYQPANKIDGREFLARSRRILLTSVFAKAYPTTVGTKTAYIKEINAVRGVHRKYLHRSLFNSVITQSAHFLFPSIHVSLG